MCQDVEHEAHSYGVSQSYAIKISRCGTTPQAHAVDMLESALWEQIFYGLW